MIIPIELLTIFFILHHPDLFCVASNDGSQPPQVSFRQMYLDIKPVNTTEQLEAIKALSLSTYYYAYERHDTSKKKPRLRVGAIGPNLAKAIPEAVELVPKRILPPSEKGGELITLHNVPVVDENTIFMYGIGATQEIISAISKLKEDLSNQIDRVVNLYGETAKLEHLISRSSDEEADLRMKIAEAEAESLRTKMDIEIQMTRDEEEFVRAQKEAELALIRRNTDLTSERLKKEDEVAQQRSKEDLRIKFESNRRLEAVRNNAATLLLKIEYEKELAMNKAAEDLKTESAKKIAEAKAEAERTNEDVHLRKLKTEAEQNRKRNIAAINAVANHLSHSFHIAAKNPRQVILFLWYISILAAGVCIAKESAQFCRVVIESTLGKPKLIRETSRKKPLEQYFLDLVECMNRIWAGTKGVAETRRLLDNVFEDVALPQPLKDRILSLAAAASKSRENDVPHRHILFYGPPGTGKTMVARKLAKYIGMEYAIMSGGDVGPLGTDAVTQIHSLFRWSKFCRNGVLLFIDEAEAFLANRNKNIMSENAHNALNALLYNTGVERKDFMMVLATNRAEDLDEAILDRCDESLFFPLPDANSREKLLNHYFETIIRQMEKRDDRDNGTNIYRKMKTFFNKNNFCVKIKNEVLNNEQIKRIVDNTDMFSGREIAKLMIAVQGAIYTSENGVLTSEMVDKIVKIKVSDHKEKRKMSSVRETITHQHLRECTNSNDDGLHQMNCKQI